MNTALEDSNRRLDQRPAVVLGFPEYEEPSHRLATAVGLRHKTVEIHRFPDGESQVRLPVPLPPHVIFCRSLHHPNDKLIELLLAGTTARALGALTLTLVAPYLCYMRQDAAFRPGEAVSQRIVGRMLADLFDAVITVDPHLHRVRSLSEAIPTSKSTVVTAACEMGAFLSKRLRNPLVLGPDAESEQWVRQIADSYDFDFAIGEKVRRGDHNVSYTLPGCDFRDREVVLVDDVASTGHTLIAAALEVSKHRPAGVSVLVTHALFVDDAVERIRAAGVQNIWSADTILHGSNVVQVAAPIAAGLALADLTFIIDDP